MRQETKETPQGIYPGPSANCSEGTKYRLVSDATLSRQGETFRQDVDSQYEKNWPDTRHVRNTWGDTEATPAADDGESRTPIDKY